MNKKHNELKLKRLCEQAKSEVLSLAIDVFEGDRKPSEMLSEFGKIELNKEDLAETPYSNFEFVELIYDYDFHYVHIYYKDEKGVEKSWISDCGTDVIYKADMLYILHDILSTKEIISFKRAVYP